MSSWEDIESEYRKKLQKLQQNCKHPIKTDWFFVEDGPFKGSEIRMCEICHFILERRFLCRNCKNYFANLTDIRDPKSKI